MIIYKELKKNDEKQLRLRENIFKSFNFIRIKLKNK